MKILVYSSNYPSPETPQIGTFVYRLIQEFVKTGNEVVVISPQKYHFKKPIKKDYGDEFAKIIRPKRLSFSNKKIGFLDTYALTQYFEAISSRKTINQLDFMPDVIYCHFLTSMIGYVNAKPDSKIPIVLASGESGGWIKEIKAHYSDKTFNKYLSKIAGIIAVSPQLKDEWVSFGFPESKIIVEPNGADLNLFKPGNKTELRIKHHIPPDKKILLFVGQFNERKGVKRIEEALDYVNDDCLAIFLGKGSLELNHSKILLAKAVPHETVSEFMALADVFVMPTLSEGSSNVIVEAMASGLPIVSSDIPEIKVQCTNDFSILVNPRSVSEIAGALNKILENDELRKNMSKNALTYSKKFDVKERANRILHFLKSVL